MWPKRSDLTPIFKACPQIPSWMSPPGILPFKNEYCMFRQGKPQYKTLAMMHVLETPHFSSWMKVGMGKDCLRMWGEVALGSILWPWARWAGGCAPSERYEQHQCHTWLRPCCCQVVRRFFIFIFIYLKPNQKLGWFCTCHQTDFFFFKCTVQFKKNIANSGQIPIRFKLLKRIIIHPSLAHFVHFRQCLLVINRVCHTIIMCWVCA